MTKKEKIIIFLCILLFSLSIILAEDGNTATSSQQNLSNVERAYKCLETEIKDDCSGATTVQQLAFSILATPKTAILNKCVEKLEAKKKSEDCFGDTSCTIKDTALAILALDHVRKNTTKYEEWLLSKRINYSEVDWIVQQDSDGETDCVLKYDNGTYQFTTKENKKLSGNFGPCFYPTYQDYWLKIDKDCFGKEIKVGCNKKFIISLLYKVPNSEKINVLSDTKEGAQNTEITFSIDSKCFGIGGSCNYEENAWAILALKKKGHDIKKYVPYLVSAEEMNKQYFPEAFSYLILEYDQVYGTRLIKMQTEGKYWEAENSVYGKYYDSALALLAMGHLTQQQIEDAKRWVWYSQESNGCWNSKNIRDSAFLLWALQRKTVEQLPTTNGGTQTTKCSQGPSGAKCMKELECLGIGGSVLRNYDCSDSSISFAVCCNKSSSLQTCYQLGGKICPSEKICSGIERDSVEGKCCLENCVEQTTAKDECTLAGGTCKTKCSTNQKESDEKCPDSSKVCCVKKTEDGKKPKRNFLWLWILLGVLIILTIIGIVMKDKIKAALYKRKNKESGEKSSLGGGVLGPSKPGFPPISEQKPIVPLRKPMPVRPLIGVKPTTPTKPSPATLSPPPQRPSVFEKLKEMSK